MTESRRAQPLQELLDRSEIADLIARLGLWLDEKRFEDARSVLTEDVAVETLGGQVQGIEAVTEQARRNHDVGRTQHVITNLLIDLDGDKATIRANLIATFVQRADEPGSHFDIGERYRFEAIRTAHGWRLSRVQASPLWTSGSRDGR
jgi:3-phenylpropionate/cinnamic acid dioxygenase small subunit